jgi:inhibitor of cysteine peptidase
MRSGKQEWNWKLVKGLFLLPVVIMIIAGCTGQPSTPPVTPGQTTPVQMAFTENDNGRTVTMPEGTEFRVSLKGNPTTGYSWNATLSTGLELLDSNFTTDAHAEGMVGVGGVFFWDIRAMEKGTQEFSAMYMRPWEPVTGGEDTFSMTCIVE